MRLRPVLLMLLVLLTLPASAAAAVREAVPAGGAASGACEASTPCTLAVAVEGAAADDTVRVAPGTYDLTTTLDASAGGLVIEADPAGAPPLLRWGGSPNAGAVALTGIGQTLRGLRIEGAVDGTALLVRADGAGADATLERLQVRNTGTGTAVAMRDSLLRDAVVTSVGANSIAVIATGTIAGSTLVAEGTKARALLSSTDYFNATAAVTIRNTILRGDVSGWDAAVYDDDLDVARTAAVDIDHSSYGAGRIDTSKSLAMTSSVTRTEGASNITTVGPLLAGLPGGLDVRQLRGSPTIDAGTSGGVPAAAATDFDGDPRVFGPAVDIGADEYLPPPLASIQTIVVGDASAAVTGLITPRGSDTTWRLEVGPTTAYGATLFGGAVVPRAVESQSVTGTIERLRAGRTYHVRLVGTSPKGTTFGPDTTFRTLSSSGPVVTRARPVLTKVRLVRSKLRRGTPAGLRLTSSAAGNVEVVVSRLERGRRKGKACVAASKRCTALVRVGGVSRKILPGANGPLPLVTTKLRRARYRLTLTVVGTNGRRSAPVRLTLRIT